VPTGKQQIIPERAGPVNPLLLLLILSWLFFACLWRVEVGGGVRIARRVTVEWPEVLGAGRRMLFKGGEPWAGRLRRQLS
jgi:hypothetical protein